MGTKAKVDPTDRFVAGYGQMHEIREFETQVHNLFLKGDVRGTTHLMSGQEAVSAGVCMALDEGDYVSGTYRGHGLALAKGVDVEALFAEMLGRAAGVCGGRAGSMNVVDLEKGLVGSFGIVGGSIAAALGASLSARRDGRVSAAFFGDGAANQAYFHECMNMAELMKLPMLFICENNLYGEFTPQHASTAGPGILARAASYGMTAAGVDGNDLWEVEEAAATATAAARAGEGPTLLECRTYRHYGHSKSDPGKYRPQEEVEEWLKRDPLKIGRERLLELGKSEAHVGRVEEQAKKTVAAALESARGAPFPEPETDQATEYSA